MNPASLLDHETTTSSQERQAYSQAMLRILSVSGVQFVRMHALDLYNTPRVKALPLSHLQRLQSVDKHVASAKIVFGGLPTTADVMVAGSGLDAQDTVIFHPDLSTLRILPYSPKSALVLGTLHDQATGLLSDLCTRGLLQQIAQTALTQHNIRFNVGAELEFMLYDAETNQPADQVVYAHSHTLNRQEEFLTDVHQQLQQQDIHVELIHAESAPGQLELVLQYQEDPVQMADHILLARETIAAVAHRHGSKAVFLPKTNAMAAGNGCHLHLSFSDATTGQNLFSSSNSNRNNRHRQSFLLGSTSADISAQGRSFLEGILQHLPALMALTVPTANSFRRIGPGCWTGHQQGWAFDDKESPLRVVANLHSCAWEHVELKLMDHTANPYLALAGVLSAGLWGMEQELTLRPSRHEETGNHEPLPGTLADSLDCLEQDELLMKQVLPKTMSQAYLAIRRSELAAELTLEEEVEQALKRA
eukprot:CAMPEP_0168741532 /NCGR_PEP_ID=MMETSP0724-20121128/12566_1 /TAXON_ID=265536 /ORGANISM="Amphiprora sp., Strain CCMP467" /LENGTH=475 /DNA_ID=CAMNT_0008789047 /DNA_START=86 /DNA_END=1513 /DNA_ORIENTATION=-